MRSNIALQLTFLLGLAAIGAAAHAQSTPQVKREIKQMQKMQPLVRAGYTNAASHPVKEFHVYTNSDGRQTYQVTSDKLPNVYNTPQRRTGESGQDYINRLKAAATRQLELTKAIDGSSPKSADGNSHKSSAKDGGKPRR
jgi:hypothetical protein